MYTSAMCLLVLVDLPIVYSGCMVNGIKYSAKTAIIIIVVVVVVVVTYIDLQ